MSHDPWSAQAGSSWSVAAGDEWSSEGFWASYSDLMAGILMIFVLSSALFTNQLLKSTETLERWRDVKAKICGDDRLTGRRDVSVHCDTGAIEFNTSGWFEFGRADMNASGPNVLSEVMPIWLEAISDPTVWDHVEAVEFGGHADRETASELGNMQVSAARAQVVMSFLVEDGRFGDFKDPLLQRGIVVGYGARDFPDTCGQDRCEEARRVVVKVNLQDTQILQELWSILQGQRQ